MSDVTDIAEMLLKRQWMMASAESCTGGLISAACTDLPGSSQWFAGGVVTYTVPWKCRLLNIPPKLIEQAGVVSHETAQAMAAGLVETYGVQAAVSTTGIAGPTGAEPGKPIGTVFIGVAVNQQVCSFECHFDGDRLAVRRQAAAYALHQLAIQLKNG